MRSYGKGKGLVFDGLVATPKDERPRLAIHSKAKHGVEGKALSTQAQIKQEGWSAQSEGRDNGYPIVGCGDHATKLPRRSSRRSILCL